MIALSGVLISCETGEKGRFGRFARSASSRAAWPRLCRDRHSLLNETDSAGRAVSRRCNDRTGRGPLPVLGTLFRRRRRGSFRRPVWLAARKKAFTRLPSLHRRIWPVPGRRRRVVRGQHFREGLIYALNSSFPRLSPQAQDFSRSRPRELLLPHARQFDAWDRASALAATSSPTR